MPRRNRYPVMADGGGELPPLNLDYLLTGRRWTEKQKAAMRWLCQVDSRRKPKNFGKFLAMIGVSRQSWYRWKALPEWPMALRLMMVLVKLETQIDVDRAAMEHMLNPEKGWQERAIDIRYGRKSVEEIYASGVIQKEFGMEVNTQPQITIEQARELFKSLPREQQDIHLTIMRGMNQIIESEVEDEDDGFDYQDDEFDEFTDEGTAIIMAKNTEMGSRLNKYDVTRDPLDDEDDASDPTNPSNPNVIVQQPATAPHYPTKNRPPTIKKESK